MADLIQRIEEPEMFFGIVAPIGADVEEIVKTLSSALRKYEYNVVSIKISDSFKSIIENMSIDVSLHESPLEQRYNSYIEAGDKLREKFTDDAFLAEIALYKIREAREKVIKENKLSTPSKTAYIIRQLKRKEEIDLLRMVYGNLFFQISIYSDRSARVDNLARKISNSHNFAIPTMYRSEAEQLVKIDESEIDNEHGQRVGDVFHEGDFIVNGDLPEIPVDRQINRFCSLIFGANDLSPSRMEYGMYTAKSASLRTLDLSRQVGAAIFSADGEVMALGANEVPKAGGGTYWSDDSHDGRDFQRKEDSNEKRKREVLSELFDIINNGEDFDGILKSEKIKKSQFMDALEYGRIIHAEMSAICDCARLGRSAKGSILYCTTFPCHMCAKHIVAAGVKTVVFLEPYPKSLASELHGDSIEIEGQSRGGYTRFPATSFTHFYGVSPKRYRDLFERKKRKDKSGKFQQWKEGVSRPIMDIRLLPMYLYPEEAAIDGLLKTNLKLRAALELSILDSPLSSTRKNADNKDT